MGVTALMLRSSVGYMVRSNTADGQGGTTTTFADPVWVRGQLAISMGSAASVGDQLAGQLSASIMLDPRCLSPHEGDRVQTRDGRLWEVLHVAKLTSPLGSECEGADLAVLSVVEILGS